MIEVPDAFARTMRARDGAAAQAWLDRLPALVESLMSRWGCRLDGPVRHGGVGLVVPVQSETDGAGVLKVSPPHPGNVCEPDAYELWQGNGAVQLRERDSDSYAMLLERAGPETLAQASAADQSVVGIMGELAGRLCVPASERLSRLDARVEEWLAELRRDAADLPDVLPPRIVAAAAATIVDLGTTQPELAVHGDLHVGNVLKAEREPWLVVDPKGLCGDPAYDVGPMIKSYAWHQRNAPDLVSVVRRAIDEFAETAGFDRQRVRAWATLHAVWGVYWECRHGHRVTRAGGNQPDVLALMTGLIETIG